jgi:anti-anti-sigma regulatory factor
VANGTIEIMPDGRGGLMKLAGDFGLLEVQQLELELARATAQRPKVLVVDVSGVTVLATIVIGAFMVAERGLRTHGGKIRLAAPSRQVMGALKYARIDALVEVFESVDAAFVAV